MSTHRAAMMASLCLFATCSSALAQSESGSTAPRPLEVQHDDKIIGFVPAHLKDVPVRKWQSQDASESSRTLDEAVTTTAYEEHLGDPPLPPGLEDEIFRVTEDVKPSKLWIGDHGNYWARADYLLWWTKGMNTPPLVTTSPQAQAGVLGPETTILFGNNNLTDNERSGGRFAIGTWLDSAECNGFEVNYLALGSESETFNTRLNQFDVLARPFFNADSGVEDARLIASLGLVQGTLDARVTSELQSWEVLYRQSGCESWGCHVDWVLGYRYAELRDRVRIDESTVSVSGPTSGTMFDLFDQFDTRNTFHGAEFGLVGDLDIDDCWSCEALVKVAIGGTVYRAGVAGQTTTTDVSGASTTVQSGLFAQGTNSGNQRWDDFGSLAEFGITLRREFSCGLEATFGYNFFYWSTVARAAEQIDRTVNPTQIPPGTLVGEARPTNLQRTDDFWAQGLRFGLEYRF